MSQKPPVLHGQYTEVAYLQFSQGLGLRCARAIAGALTWPFVWPLAQISKFSDMVFRTASELMSHLPYIFGVIVRGEFYRFALRRCGTNVTIEFGTVFIYRDITIGSNVIIGRYNIIHHCDFGNFALTGERCTFLSGSRQHNTTRTDVPMALQAGRLKRISVGDDCWIGAHTVIMDDVGPGAIVGAGSIVTKPVAEFAIVVGNPARVVRRRGEDAHEHAPPTETEAYADA